MPSPTRIASLEVTDLSMRLHAPFGISGGAQHVAHNLLVTVRLEGGAVGLGEAAPFPAFNGETPEAARDAVERARAVVEGLDASAFRRVAAAVADPAVAGTVGSARCAIETAALDALARHHRLPLWSLFGGAEQRLETDITVTTGGVDEARVAARSAREQGFRALKVKVGGVALGRDVERVAAIFEEARPDRLLLDGNAAYAAPDAIDLLRRLAALGVVPALFEQPVAADDLDGLAQVARATGCPVAADESLTSARAAARLASARAVDVFNVKIMKCGVVEALDIAAVARAHGVGLMIGGMVESTLAMSTSACLAAGLGGFAFVDLDTPLFIADEPFVGGFDQRGPSLSLAPIEAGHGVALRP